MTEQGVMIGYNDNGVPTSVASFGPEIGVLAITAKKDASGGGLRVKEFDQNDPELINEIYRWYEETVRCWIDVS